jgi:hypothetical protein
MHTKPGAAVGFVAVPGHSPADSSFPSTVTWASSSATVAGIGSVAVAAISSPAIRLFSRVPIVPRTVSPD